MAKVNIPSGNIETGVVYEVNGTGTVTYNGTGRTNGQRFVGLSGVTTYTVSGTVQVWQVFTLQAISIEQELPLSYTDRITLNGISIELEQKVFYTDAIILQGLSIEVEDYPSNAIIWMY